MKKRALKQLSLVKDHNSRTLLDLGPGVGLSLHFAKAKIKYAYELDESCHETLQNEIGAKLVNIFEDNIHVDGIIASHFLEHLFIEDLPTILNRLYTILNHGGYFICEVPPRGGEAVYNMKNTKSRGKIMYEPHTISFSTAGLYNIIKKSNFIIESITHDNLFDMPKTCQNFEDDQIVCCCYKP